MAERREYGPSNDWTCGQDYHLRRPGDHPTGWRYVLSTTEEWIKEKQDWPANLQKRKQQEKDEQEQHDQNENSSKQQSSDEEHAWRKQSNGEDSTKHHDAYATDGGKEQLQDGQMSNANGQPKEESEYQKLRKKYSPQEIALLQSLQHERDYVKQIKQNDGKRKSSVADHSPLLSIDEADQFSPDNWIPRSSNLIRLTGKHPLNAEPKLTSLFDAGLTTPNEYHYVRNHGYSSSPAGHCGPLLTSNLRPELFLTSSGRHIPSRSKEAS